MSSLQLETDLTEWFIQAVFISSCGFAAIYIPFFHWRETLTGKAVTTLILSIAGTLLHSVLLIWGVETVTIKHHVTVMTGFWNIFLTWISIICLGTIAISITLLIWKIIQLIFSETENIWLWWLCKILRIGRKI